MACIVFLLGTRAAGKTSVLDHLKQRGILTLTPSTTRERRNDKDFEYYFESNWGEVQLAWDICVGQHRYGMRGSELEKVGRGMVGVTVFEPGNIASLKRFRENTDFETVTVGLDTIDTIETQLNRSDGDPNRVVDERELEEHIAVTKDCDVVFSGNRQDVGDAVVAVCRLFDSCGGVVDGKTIRSLVKGGALLKRADLGYIQSASYDLRLGTQAWCQGNFMDLDEKNPSLKIPPYSYAIVTAEEEACIPRFLTASYDLTVSGFMDGLILSNGPQVDPGYRGALFCTLFNGRDVARGVTIGKHFGTIQFYRTTRVTIGYKGKYQGKTTLRSFVSENTAVSPGGNIVERIDKLERSIDDKIAPVRQYWMWSLSILLIIHLTIAGWLWFGGPNLGTWLSMIAGNVAPVEQSVSECVSEREVLPVQCPPATNSGTGEDGTLLPRVER